MKKITLYIIFAILAFALMSCSIESVTANSSSSDENDILSNEPGIINVNLMIPDYYGLSSDSRAIAPNTASIKMQYKQNGSWIDVNNTVDVESATKTKADGLPTGMDLPYSKMTTQFSLPKGTYSAGEIQLLLCDSTGKTITSGTNTAAVTVAAGRSSSATFYTKPSSTISKTQTTSLTKNQMVFVSVTMQAGSTYTITLNTQNNPPVIVLFDNIGKFIKYYEPNNDNVSFTMTPTKTGLYYLGIWAKDNANSGFTVDVTCSAAILAEDFESGSFTTNGWTLGSTHPEIAVQGTNAAKLNADYCKSSTMTKTVNVTGECELSFMYYQQNTSGILHYIIDGTGVKAESSYRKWSTVVVPLTSGSHTIAFQSSNMYTNSWIGSSSEKDTIYIDNIFIKPAAEQIGTMERVTFDEEPNPNYWNLGTATITNADNSYSRWTTCVDGAFPNSHGNVLETTYNNAVKIRRIKRTSQGVLTFWHKSFGTSGTVTVNDNGTAYTFQASELWKKAAVPLSAGEHTITIKAGGRIDDVEIKDGSAYDITPRGLQQTYIGGHTIQYALSPTAENVTWSVSGSGTIVNGKFTPTSAGEFTVTAKIGSTIVAESTVKVHENNHGAFTIGDTTFTGVDNSILSSSVTQVGITKFNLMPNTTTFSCDGFFPLVGTVTPSGSQNITFVKITKDGYSTSYYLQNTFDQRIWLRFGPGDYKVKICDGACEFRTDIDGNQGAIKTSSNLYVQRTLTVTNTNTMPADEAMWLMPSYYINNDDYRIQNVAADIRAGLSPSENTPADKLRALHDWETDYLYYDLSSISSYESGTHRRHQEAIWVLNNTTAVCEGYATLYASLCRAIGIKAKYSSSDKLNHAYTFIWFNGDYRMTDVTWDDPVSSSDSATTQNRNVGKYCYDYFLRSNNDGRDDTQHDSGRGEPVAPLSPDGFDRGWY
ncbi:MAG: transglutaminase domain-containing protein [Spirochaetales bacterium]|nr:transglutaminase domain-containing protein [Spirochaetales bacterium]